MMAIIIESPKFCRLISWFIEVDAITLWPFIICRDKSNIVMINHEKIHIKQQAEMLIIFFFIGYILNWIINLFYYKFNLFEAYINIVFEKDAYLNEEDLEYLNSRDLYSWVNYFKEE